MQAAGQYGEVPQYVASRVGASHGHMFNLSHEMSLSSSGSPAATQGHAQGHSLSLAQSPAQSQTSQSHNQSQIVSSTQAQFLQSQTLQQQQHGQNGYGVSMGTATPRAVSATPSAPQAPPQALQSAAQQLQADIKQHQQQQLLQSQSQQAAAQDLGTEEGPHNQQQSGDPIQIAKPKESPAETRSNVAIAVPSTHDRLAVAILDKATKEETSGDGDEVDEEGERGSGGNRWPREEALALLKIRSEMDTAFRDSSLKGPLWEEISRKLAEMGYHRSAKKCKEKFENVHKYYKRTKEGKTGRQDGKSYRFFAQLEALYGKAGGADQQQYHSPHPHHHQLHHLHHHQQQHHHPHLSSPSTLINLNNSKSANPHGMTSLNTVGGNNMHPHCGGLFPSLPADNQSSAVGFNIAAAGHGVMNMAIGSNVSGPLPLASYPPFNPSSAAAAAAAATHAHIARTLERVESMKREPENNSSLQYLLDTSDESDDDYDDDDEGDRDAEEDDEFHEPATRENSIPSIHNRAKGKKRKRKSLKKYLLVFEKIMKKVLDKQEHMQQKFLEALERRDQDRMIREEAWKRQEMARLNREHDVRATERALSASRDASLVAFLQKMTGQTVPLPHQNSGIPLQTNNLHSTSTALVPADYMQNDTNADRDLYDPSSSKRWPKPEVLALIKLRTSLEQKFHEPGSKAVLWEDISAAMASQGFSRTAKRCKEKWENINKYFKKAKESNKKRPENAKTCPYFHHLNALYKEGLLGGGASSISSKHLLLAEKAEEHSEDVGVNTSKYSGEESGLAYGGDSVVLHPRKIVEASGLPNNNMRPSAASVAIMMASHPPEIATTASLTLMTSCANSETKMHMFMGSERGDSKGSAAPDDTLHPQTMIDLSAAASPAQAAAHSLPFNLDHAMSSSRSLTPATAPAVKPSEPNPLSE